MRPSFHSSLMPLSFTPPSWIHPLFRSKPQCFSHSLHPRLTVPVYLPSPLSISISPSHKNCRKPFSSSLLCPLSLSSASLPHPHTTPLLHFTSLRHPLSHTQTPTDTDGLPLSPSRIHRVSPAPYSLASERQWRRAPVHGLNPTLSTASKP
jgi:hypothetical protein